ncbi:MULTISPECIES: hypothetical protein [Chroococcidiopsis]|nr:MULTISPECIES: hypothetical protein [Chroococcidiopsis]
MSGAWCVVRDRISIHILLAPDSATPVRAGSPEIFVGVRDLW